ncbi:hypothetical protein [Marinilabilia salmonicolor]|uniref:hypothetical protein n=1 Tax=Marinilabilia salmonicolor TaxID=989 RepID=UPI001F41A8E6|nr:hypothetical protein [Marinilabilia salmonicolor]
MTQSICTYGFIPVRTEPAEGAQLETQILFGESFDLLEHVPDGTRYSVIMTVTRGGSMINW